MSSSTTECVLSISSDQRRRTRLKFSPRLQLRSTRSIWKMLGPFATASRRYIAIYQVSLLSHASYSYSTGGVRCPRQRRQRRQRQQRQRVTEGTAMAPWNWPNNTVDGRPLFLTPMTVDASDAVHQGLSSSGTICCGLVANLVVSNKWSLSIRVHICANDRLATFVSSGVVMWIESATVFANLEQSNQLAAGSVGYSSAAVLNRFVESVSAMWNGLKSS